MNIGTVLGYFLVACTAFAFLDRILTLNPVKWVLAIIGAPFSLIVGCFVLVVSGAPPTTQQIEWYIAGTAILGVLIFLGRLYEWFQLPTGRKIAVSAVILDQNGQTTGYIR
jgi:amino acid transporter